MSLDDTLNRRKSDTGAFKCLAGMQALKYAKELIHVLHIEADTVVPHEHHNLIFARFGASNLDFGLGASPRKLDGIGEKINKYQPQHGTIPIEIGQGADVPNNVAAIRFLPD